MSNPFVGEIRMAGFNFAPQGWALCNGQLMSISQNQALFTLLGTQFGGDGVNTFALPNLQGQMAVHQGTSRAGYTYVMGQIGGAESVTLNAQQMPSHNHLVQSSAAGGTQASPVGGYPAIESTGTSLDYIASPPGLAAMNAGMISQSGGNQPHENRPPYLCVNFIISLQGIFPSRS